MRSIRYAFSILLLTLCILPARAETNPQDRLQLFEEANRLYEAQEFEKAREIYRQLATGGGQSREVFFNLANADFRLGKLGEASLWYRRALLLDPRMVEASQNLRLIRQRVGFLEFETTGLANIAGWLSEAEWKAIRAAGVWMLVIGVVALVAFRPRQPSGGLLLALAICGIIIGIIGGAGAYLYAQHHDPSRRAIVVEKDIVAQSGPYPDAKQIIALPPGSEVLFRHESGYWSFVEIPGQSAGWVRSEAIQPLWPPPEE